MTAPDESGRRESVTLTAEQRARIQRAVDSACSELEQETARLVEAFRAMADAERARRRAWRIVAIVALALAFGGVGLWALGRVLVAIGGVL